MKFTKLTSAPVVRELSDLAVGDFFIWKVDFSEEPTWVQILVDDASGRIFGISKYTDSLPAFCLETQETDWYDKHSLVYRVEVKEIVWSVQ